MKFTVRKPVEIDVKLVGIDVPVRYDDEDMPYDFPFREGETWRVQVGIEDGKIFGWPDGVAYDLHMKVCDSGVYTLLDSAGLEIASIQDYVPHGVVPGEYGDYISMEILSDGTIANWPREPDVSAFFSGAVK